MSLSEDMKAFENVKKSIEVAEKRSIEVGAELKLVDSELGAILKELSVNTVEEAEEKLKKLLKRIKLVEEEIRKEAAGLVGV